MRGYLRENPEYIDIVQKVIDHEKSLDPEDFEDMNSIDRYNEQNGTDHEVMWDNGDIDAHPTRLYQLEVNGILDRVLDTNNATMYSLSVDIDDAQDVIDDMDVGEDGSMKAIHDFPDEDELPDGIFDRVIGYDDVKWLLRRGITTNDITNFLLLGPPGSAKSVFLLALRDMDKAEYIMASESTSAGVLDLMFDAQPKYMLIDEFDDMKADHQSVFASYTETGIVKETKYDKDREMETNTKTFAAANVRSNIKDNILDRFTVLEFDKYTREEFIEICEHVLPMEEDKSKEESRTIAEAVWENDRSGDVREAIQIARLSRGDPERVISTLEKYSDSNSGVRGI